MLHAINVASKKYIVTAKASLAYAETVNTKNKSAS